MILAPFTYVAPDTLDEAIALLKDNDDVQLLAGGQSLLTEMKLGHVTPSMLIDLHKIEALRGIGWSGNGSLHIGAMTPLVEIAEDKNIQRKYTALVEAINSVGDAQLRNRRTLGGTLAFNAVGADLPAVALALDATFTLSGPRGTRTLSASDFNTELRNGPLNNEIIHTVNFPALDTRSGTAYDKFKNRATQYALCGVATSVTLTADDTLIACHIAVTGATRYATRLIRAEIALNGKQATMEAVEAASKAADNLNCISDLAASAEYRAFLTGTLTERSLVRAIARARD